jgi:hypothetical protein
MTPHDGTATKGETNGQRPQISAAMILQKKNNLGKFSPMLGDSLLPPRSLLL